MAWTPADSARSSRSPSWSPFFAIFRGQGIKRAESCHAQMSTFLATLINKMQPSVDKMFATPQKSLAMKQEKALF